MEEEKGRNIKGIFRAAILFSVPISHVIPAFDTTQCTLRTNKDHRHLCEMIYKEVQRSNTKTALQTAESQFGLRYSILLELLYCLTQSGTQLLTQCTTYFQALRKRSWKFGCLL